MAVSQNGWPLSPARSLRAVPGADVRLIVADGPAGDLLIYVAQEFNKRVEKLAGLDNGGYNLRKIAGTDVWSNHASATAIDLEWLEHPFGARGTFTKDQVAEIRKILSEVSYAVGWGGDYRGSGVDEMHFEIVETPANVAKAAAALTAPKPEVVPTTTPSPKPTIQTGSEGEDVKLVQRFLGIPQSEPGYGHFGPKTETAVREYQRRQGLTVDGVVGPRTWGRILSGLHGSASGASRPDGASRPTLRRGSEGEHVKTVQGYLNRVFPAYSRLRVDGAFGEGTEQVVREFQRRSGLVVDGVIGAETWKRLGF